MHESGIHTDGILKDPKTYEPYRPEEVGTAREIALGKHSGKSALIYRLSKLGIQLGKEDAGPLLARVKEMGALHKRPVNDSELLSLCAI